MPPPSSRGALGATPHISIGEGQDLERAGGDVQECCRQHTRETPVIWKAGEYSKPPLSEDGRRVAFINGKRIQIGSMRFNGHRTSEIIRVIRVTGPAITRRLRIRAKRAS